jgi:DNA primase
VISDETIDRVREAADIVQIIGEYVNLKRTGTDFRGPCPFHQGKNRNFSVSPRKGIYYCFVCHEGGDVFTFLQKRLGMDWPSAVREVAGKVGIEIREIETRRDALDPREPLWEANAAAAEHFRELLWNDDEGKHAREYLTTRSVSRELADRVGLGFASRDPERLRTYMHGLGYDDHRMLEAGLLVEREHGEEKVLRPRFRDRLMFPILDVSGRHVGFGGRLLGPGEPKYLNSAESAVFTKGRLLYGLHWARGEIRRDDRVLLVEGYFDCVRLIDAGIETVVAPLGTALTEAQAALVVRYTKNVFLLYDSDKPGLKATFRAADEFLRHGASVRVVTLPDGEDPDTFVARHGRERMESHIAGALDVLERKIQLLERAGWFADLHKKRRALDRLLPTIRAASDPLTRELYLSRVAEAAGVDKDVLTRELAENAHSRSGRSAPGTRDEPASMSNTPNRAGSNRFQPRGNDRRTQTPVREEGEGAEKELVRAMLLDRSFVEIVAEQHGPDSFRHPIYHTIFATLLRIGPDAGLDLVSDALGEAEVEQMQHLIELPGEQDNLRAVVEASLLRLRRRAINEQLDQVQRALKEASEDEKGPMLQRKMLLRKEKDAL